MNLKQALKWADDNSHPEAVARLRSRRVAKVLADTVRGYAEIIDAADDACELMELFGMHSEHEYVRLKRIVRLYELSTGTCMEVDDGVCGVCEDGAAEPRSDRDRED